MLAAILFSLVRSIGESKTTENVVYTHNTKPQITESVVSVNIICSLKSKIPLSATKCMNLEGRMLSKEEMQKNRFHVFPFLILEYVH